MKSSILKEAPVDFYVLRLPLKGAAGISYDHSDAFIEKIFIYWEERVKYVFQNETRVCAVRMGRIGLGFAKTT